MKNKNTNNKPTVKVGFPKEMKYSEEQFKKDLKNNIVQLPDSSKFEICKGWIEALKEKGKKEKLTYENMIKYMVAETVRLWDKGKTKDKFGETDLSNGGFYEQPIKNMTDSFESIFYSYIRFQIMKKAGKSIGLEVVSIDELVKEQQGLKKLKKKQETK